MEDTPCTGCLILPMCINRIRKAYIYVNTTSRELSNEFTYSQKIRFALSSSIIHHCSIASNYILVRNEKGIIIDYNYHNVDILKEFFNKYLKWNKDES